MHCLFSHFEFFDSLLDDMLQPKDWQHAQKCLPWQCVRPTPLRAPLTGRPATASAAVSKADFYFPRLCPMQDWLYHQRYSPAYMRKTWVGYPVQANLWRLPEAEVMGIVQDLAIKSAHKPNPNTPFAPRHFGEWLEAGFGKALTESFMAPYNAKVWAHP